MKTSESEYLNMKKQIIPAWIILVCALVIAVGSVGIIMWRRTKKKLKDKVGIDFDKNKETEEAVVAVKTEDEQQKDG